MGVNDVGAGVLSNSACPNPPELTKWGGKPDPSLVGKRPVDEAMAQLKEAQAKCPDCAYTTAFPDYMKQHKVDCDRQLKNFEEREKAKEKGMGVSEEGVSEEKVAAMIEKANQPIVSALKDIASLLAAKKPRKKKPGSSKKKDEVKPV